MSARTRVGVATPLRDECDMLSAWLLADGFEPIPLRAAAVALGSLRGRPFDALLVDASFAFGGGLHAAYRSVCPSSPTIVIGDGPGTEAAAARVGASSVQRPVDRELLMCMLGMALLDDRPMRRSERKPVPRFEAYVEGAPASLLDVSREGMRLEMQPGRRRALPPVFRVRLPLIGIGLTVQRVWLSAAPGWAVMGSTWCGGTLYDNAMRVEQRWRHFVDVVPQSRGSQAP